MMLSTSEVISLTGIISTDCYCFSWKKKEAREHWWGPTCLMNFALVSSSFMMLISVNRYCSYLLAYGLIWDVLKNITSEIGHAFDYEGKYYHLLLLIPSFGDNSAEGRKHFVAQNAAAGKYPLMNRKRSAILGRGLQWSILFRHVLLLQHEYLKCFYVYIQII